MIKCLFCFCNSIPECRAPDVVAEIIDDKTRNDDDEDVDVEDDDADGKNS